MFNDFFKRRLIAIYSSTPNIASSAILTHINGERAVPTAVVSITTSFSLAYCVSVSMVETNY